MPELSEVEVARQRLEAWWSGRAAVEVRVHDPALVEVEPGALEALWTSPVAAVRRRGKYLIVDFEVDDGAAYCAAVVHFRMTGKITTHDGPKRRFTRLSWRVPGTGWLVFDDARRLGGVELFGRDPLEAHPRLEAMGPEPHDLVDGAALRERLGRSRRRLKAALLDQDVLAGVGNIAVSELYWRTGIHPEVRAHEISDDALDALVAAMPPYFDWLVDDQMADEIVYLNESKEADNPFDVYAREGEACRRCGAEIERVVTGGRSTYFCPTCQPEQSAPG